MTAYTANDLARHIIWEEGGEPFEINEHNKVDAGATVAEVIIDTCQVGYGGHYFEVMEDDLEGDTIHALADHLSSLYSISAEQVESMLESVRAQYMRYMLEAEKLATERWRRTDWYVELRPNDLDRCPLCGKHILDFDEEGCEAPDGQRWCTSHALDAVAQHRPIPRPGEESL